MEPEPKVNVLLVDDQPSNLLALEAILGGVGLNLVRAGSGERGPAARARRRLRRDPDGRPDAGHGRLRGGRPDPRARPLEAHADHLPDRLPEHRRAGLPGLRRSGAVDFLSKPIVPAVLRSKVAVFVELFQKTEQVRRQAAQLHETQRREHERALAEQKRRWEVERLREEAAREKRIAEELAQRAEELARTIAERIRAEAELAAVRDELAVQLADMTRLHALSDRLSNSLELTAVLREVLAAVTGFQGTERGRPDAPRPRARRDVHRGQRRLHPGASSADVERAGASPRRRRRRSTAVISGGIVVEGRDARPGPHAPPGRRAPAPATTPSAPRRC